MHAIAGEIHTLQAPPREQFIGEVIMKMPQMAIKDDYCASSINHFFDGYVFSLFDYLLKLASPQPGARVIELTRH